MKNFMATSVTCVYYAGTEDIMWNTLLCVALNVAFLIGVITGTLTFTQMLIFGGILLLRDFVDTREKKGKA